MKVIIAGSRYITSSNDVIAAIKESGFAVTEVVCGGATGVDEIGKQWALSYGIPVSQFNPDWKSFGKSAGPIRNRSMATYADALIAVWDGKSRGTKSMMYEMDKLNKPVFMYIPSEHKCSVNL